MSSTSASTSSTRPRSRTCGDRDRSSARGCANWPRSRSRPTATGWSRSRATPPTRARAAGRSRTRPPTTSPRPSSPLRSTRACVPAAAETSPTGCLRPCATSSAGTRSSRPAGRVAKAGPVAKLREGGPEQMSLTREQPATLTQAENPLTAGLERLPVPATTLVIFGATGDLARRKLLPALYNLAHDGALPQRFHLVGVARREKAHEDYRAECEQASRQFSRRPPDATVLQGLLEQVKYVPGVFDDEGVYAALGEVLDEFQE